MNSSPNAKVLAIASAVREALEDLYPCNDGCRNLCVLSACAIAALCGKLRLPVLIRGGFYVFPVPIPKPQFGNADHVAFSRTPRRERAMHAWIEHQQSYIDVTLTQFEPAAPRVAVLPIDDPRFRGGVVSLDVAIMELTMICGYPMGELARVMQRAVQQLKSVEVAA